MNYIYTLKDFRCDKHCPYCITKILNKVVPEDINNFSEDLKKLKGVYHYFILSGNGEPSLYSYDNLKMVIDSVNSSGKFKDFRVQTSGALFRQSSKLELFDGWWKEITVISPNEKEDMEFFQYKVPYFDKTYRADVRCNYTLLLKKFNSKVYLDDIKILIEKYNYVALKLLDTNDPWVLNNGVPYGFKDYLISELEVLLGTPKYDSVNCRYEWITFKCKVTMSFGKVKGHDNIQIENIGGRK